MKFSPPRVLTPAAYARRAGRGKWVLAPHLALLNRKLADVLAGRCLRLIVSMPPRHGKSEFISKYFPALFLGTWPDRRVILTSYEAGFAATWGRKVRDLIEETGPAYFGVRVRSDSSAADRWDLDGRDGGMQTAGVGGPLTGKGADLLILDDPIKNAEEANSQTIRDKHGDWWGSTAYTRLQPGAAAVVMATRWHEDDLPGRLIAAMGAGGERWDVLNLSALAGEGDPLGRGPGVALWPDRYPAERLEEIRRAIGSYWFAALYQGAPQPADGGYFKRHWLRHWRPEGEYLRPLDGDGRPLKPVRPADCRRFGVMDIAFSTKKDADYTVITAWALDPDNNLYLLDMHRDRLDGPQLVPAVARMSARHGLQYVGIEDAAGQTLVIQAARRAGLSVRGLKADKDKVTRAIPATVRMEAGQIYLPAGHPELGTIEDELLSFPRGAHDDVVDNVAYAAIEAEVAPVYSFL